MIYHGLTIDYTFDEEHLLVIEGEASLLNTLDLKMLMYNNIPNMLPFKLMEIDNLFRLSYTLKEYRLLFTYLREQRRDPIEYLQLFISLCELIKQSKAYLLETKSFLLHPDYLFVSQDGKLQLVYLPLSVPEKQDTVEQLKQIIFKYLVCVEDQQRQFRQDLLELCEQSGLSLNTFSERLGRLKSRYVRAKDRLDGDSPVVKSVRTNVSGQEKVVIKEALGFKKLLYPLKQLFRITKKSSKEAKGTAVYPTRINPLTTLLVKESVTVPVSNAGLTLVYLEQRVLIERFPFVIGRNESGVDYRLEDTSISRIHAEITSHDQLGFMVRDLGSRNETYLNGVKLVPYKHYPLKRLDQLTLGSETLTVE